MSWYDKEGKSIDVRDADRLLNNDAYKRVGWDVLPSGLKVSTVWLGLDHSFGRDGPPLIFETMVFMPGESFREVDSARYATKEAALAGHTAMLSEWKDKPVPVDL